MAMLVVESLFSNHINIGQISSLIDLYFNSAQIVTINNQVKIINRKKLHSCYMMYTNFFIPKYSSELFNNKVLLIGVAAKEEITETYFNINADIVFVSNESINVAEKFLSNNGYFRVIIRYDDLEKTCKLMEEIVEKRLHITKLLKEESYVKVSAEYEATADLLNRIGLKSVAKDFYAYAAIMAEKTEKWRRISYLWYSAFEPIKNGKDYQDYNTLSHTFPSISFEKWDSFSEEEKLGRALQYAAYSDDNHNGPSDSYWIYEIAAHQYWQAGIYERAVECAVSATNRYASCFHTVKSEMIELWKELLSDSRSKGCSDLLFVSFNDIYHNLNLYEVEIADFFYIEMQKIKQNKLLSQKKYIKFAFNKVWSILTDYGTGVTRIVISTVLLVCLVFPIAYFFLTNGLDVICRGEFVQTLNHFVVCVVTSFNVFLGIGSVSEIEGWFHVIVIVEAFYAYVVLIIISTNIIKKIIAQN